MEVLGGWQNSRPDDGLRHRNLLRNREEVEEETNAGLSLREFSVSQLVGV